MKSAPRKTTSKSAKSFKAQAATERRLGKGGEREKVSTPPAMVQAFPIVGVGASAGGLEAFSALLRPLPAKTGMAFVLVQHLDPKHGSILPEILSRTTRIPVVEVKNGIAVEPDRVYVIPANTDMAIKDGILRLEARELTRGQHLPIDHFFLSLAEDRGERAIGIILSGTASDGTAGCQAIKAAGGITFAQDEESAKYDSMPRSAVSAGCIDFILPPKAIARELTRISQHPYMLHAPPQKEAGLAIARGDELAPIFSMLLKATGVDFAHYKQSTLLRRLRRRMVLHKIEKLPAYVRYIQNAPGELEELYRDLLIPVTGFFRDPEMFVALESLVLPSLLHSRRSDDPLRIWIAGCSTGEEVYSFAVTILEYIWKHDAATMPLASAATKAFQLFATDISETALARARRGLYSEAEVAGVAAARLKHFFVKANGGYQINKSVRDMCIFARHNITRDPPFSNLDLISCRNLLIYLGPVLQKRVIPALHYALKPEGYLILGESESLGAYSEHFTLIDKKHKIHRKKKDVAPLLGYFAGSAYPVRGNEGIRPAEEKQGGFAIDKEVDRLLFNRYVPASLVVNQEMEIVQIRGRTGAYLEPAAGNPTFSLSKMAREGLLVDLRPALSKAKRENQPVRKEGVRVQSNGGIKEVDLEVIPLSGETPRERYYVIVFQEAARAAAPSREKGQRGKAPKGDNALARENERLRSERAQLRGEMRSLIEEHETTLEEFKSANEEVLSGNEELQSTNEELETAKEELQSGNEELATLNDELKSRNTELSVANNDLTNVLANVNIAVVIVSNDLRIRRFTPPAEKVLNLLPGDLGRALAEIRPNLEVEDVTQIAREAIDTGSLREREAREKDGPWYLMRARPYKTWENKIDGAVISFQDIDTLKRSLDQTRHYADTLIENAREATLILDDDLRVKTANKSFYNTFQVSPEEIENRFVYELGNGAWNIPNMHDRLANVIPANARVDDFEVQRDFQHLGPCVMLVNAWRIEPEPGRQMIQLVIQDVTEKRKADEDLKQQAALLDLAHNAILVCGLDGVIRFWSQGAERTYGWTKEEALGKVARELLRTEFPVPREEIEKKVTTNGRWEGDLAQFRRDGARIVVSSHWSLQPASEHGPPAILMINADVTERREDENSLRILSGSLIRRQDSEWRRIALELHDSAGQKLAALKMCLSSVAKQRRMEPKPRRSLTEALELTDDVMQEVRTLAYGLHPPMLDDGGLISAIRWLVDGFSRHAGLSIHLTAPAKFARLPREAEIALFRVVQESLTNVHLHSGSQTAHIKVSRSANEVRLEVQGEGGGNTGLQEGSSPKGFTPGLGIIGMRERMKHVGGRLEIISGSGGTIVRAVLPVKQST